MKKRIGKLDERGYALLQIFVSLPILVLLLGSMACTLLWGAKMYLYEMADWVLQEEMRTVMERVTGHLQTAYRVDLSGEEWTQGNFRIFPAVYGPEDLHQSYSYEARMPDSADAPKIYEMGNYLPLTGDNMWGPTGVLCFRGKLKPNCMLRIELEGFSSITWHHFKLYVDMFLPEMARKKKAEMANGKDG